MIKLLVAHDLNFAIGCENSIPWRIKSDSEYFRQQSLGQVLLMGRKTFESLGNKPLPKRHHIVLTSRPLALDHLSEEKRALVHWARSFDDAKAIYCQQFCDRDLIIAGGAAVYERYWPYVEEAHFSVVQTRVTNADIFIGDYTETLKDFKLLRTESFEQSLSNQFKFVLNVYSRIKNRATLCA